MALTNFPNGITSFGIPVLGGADIPYTGKYWFVDPANGSDGNTGIDPSHAFATLYKAHSVAVSGRNDVVYLIGNGAASGSARLSTALAQTIDSTVTAGTLVWSKNATHLIGITAPTCVAQRARIAPPTGTYTQTTFGSANFVTVSGVGCQFANISLFHGFSTGGTNQICWTDTGGRNAYTNMDFGGMGDAASAQDAGSRAFKLGGAGIGETTFRDCTFGLDTVTRTVANATLELTGATPRNTFINCTFPFQTSSATVLGVLLTGAAAVDRWTQFVGCRFINNIKSTSTVMTQLVSMTSASPGGLLLFDAGCMSIGITEWGDTNGLANSYVAMAAPSAAAGGIGVNPS